jgi:hypothetical protein
MQLVLASFATFLATVSFVGAACPSYSSLASARAADLDPERYQGLW